MLLSAASPRGWGNGDRLPPPPSKAVVLREEVHASRQDGENQNFSKWASTLRGGEGLERLKRINLPAEHQSFSYRMMQQTGDFFFVNSLYFQWH